MRAGRSRPERWGGDKAKIDAVIDEAVEGVREDKQALTDFYYDCRRWHPEFFKNMTLEDFSAWNKIRIAHLDDKAPLQTYGQAKAAIEANCR